MKGSSKSTRHQSRGASLLERKINVEKKAQEVEDKTICFICANKTKYWAIGECNHPCCIPCSLRLKVLFKTNSCPYCKVDLGKVYYIDSNSKQFNQINLSQSEFTDEKLDFVCSNKAIFDYALYILSFNCPYKNCKYVDHDGWKGLKNHVKVEHNIELCVEHRKVFPHEHKIYPPGALRGHYKSGNGADFRGHPVCGFCKTSFYDGDMLFEHCRKYHEQCFICQKKHGNKDVYFKNFYTLAEHFENDHYPCPHPSCIERRFVVFPNQLDLKAHEAEVHGKAIVGQRAKWEARQVPISFEIERYQGSRQQHRSRDRNNKDSKQRSSNSAGESSKEPNPSNNSAQNATSSNDNSEVTTNSRLNKPKSYGKLSSPSNNDEHHNAENVEAHSKLLSFALKALSNDNLKLEQFRKLTGKLKESRVSPQIYYNELKKNYFTIEQDLLFVLKSVTDLLNDPKIKNSISDEKQFPSLTPLSGSSTNLSLIIQRQSKNPWNPPTTSASNTRPKPKSENKYPSSQVSKVQLNKNAINVSDLASSKSNASSKLKTDAATSANSSQKLQGSTSNATSNYTLNFSKTAKMPNPLQNKSQDSAVQKLQKDNFPSLPKNPKSKPNSSNPLKSINSKVTTSKAPASAQGNQSLLRSSSNSSRNQDGSSQDSRDGSKKTQKNVVLRIL
ncbi:hypothetical protein BB560_006847 [Smittium megazygosporum]|uniref:RING-type E3 ubiquitin transferase n=1 Tax=Smittium megazygosporum TaxID=133381 RepID=A0A2T9Y0V0_9FUNG|nr:hypothetical protein BB560_006847 [Smittium megazygosporum]